jgi:hypothetical protein
MAAASIMLRAPSEEQQIFRNGGQQIFRNHQFMMTIVRTCIEATRHRQFFG